MRGSIVRKMVYIAAMTAILEAAKFALNGIANVELITLLCIVFTKRFGWKMSLPAMLLFAVLECMWWGIATWSAVYFYIWPILVLLTVWIKKAEDPLYYSILSAAFGFLFGMFCSVFTLVTAGWNAAVAWWITGIPYDLVHGVSNFILCLLLYTPLMKALSYVHEP